MPSPFPEQRRLSAEYRTELGRLGFSDDGTCLQGRVEWSDDSGQRHKEPVEITFDGGFPHTPPRVRPLADSSPRSLHQERAGHLCLFDRSELAGAQAPWRDPARLLDRAAEWFVNRHRGWPDDEDVDLERYLPVTEGLVVYDSDSLEGRTGMLRLTRGRSGSLVTRVSWQAPPAASGSPSSRSKRRGRRRLRTSRPYGWLADVGEINRPLLTWADVAALLGDSAGPRARNIRFHGMQLFLLRYTRTGKTGYLALRVTPRGTAPGGIELVAQEAADDALAVRTLRSGDQAQALGNRPVAVVGCGAVGSHVADLLHRAGLRRIRLVDHQVLRPGNCIRHLAGAEYVGYEKTDATAAVLARTGLSVEGLRPIHQHINTLQDALSLFADVQLVIDATGDNRTTQLLAAAAHESDRTLLSVALIRHGGIAVVDRLGESQHGEPLGTPAALSEEPADLRERGCGDAVSRTPPHSAVAAAALTTRLAIDELLGKPVPTSTFEVLEPQPDSPYDARKIITS